MPNENKVRGRAADIETYLREIAAGGQWAVGEALPTTRALGEKFGVANTTASRVFHRLELEGLVWRQDNGRYFLEASRQLMHRPKPIACLTRELERWSGVYRAIMAGVSAYTSERQTALLLWRSESLVSHSNVKLPPDYGSLKQQNFLRKGQAEPTYPFAVILRFFQFAACLFHLHHHASKGQIVNMVNIISNLLIFYPLYHWMNLESWL